MFEDIVNFKKGEKKKKRTKLGNIKEGYQVTFSNYTFLFIYLLKLTNHGILHHLQSADLSKSFFLH